MINTSSTYCLPACYWLFHDIPISPVYVENTKLGSLCPLHEQNINLKVTETVRLRELEITPHKTQDRGAEEEKG